MDFEEVDTPRHLLRGILDTAPNRSPVTRSTSAEAQHSRSSTAVSLEEAARKEPAMVSISPRSLAKLLLLVITPLVITPLYGLWCLCGPDALLSSSSLSSSLWSSSSPDSLVHETASAETLPHLPPPTTAYAQELQWQIQDLQRQLEELQREQELQRQIQDLQRQLEEERQSREQELQRQIQDLQRQLEELQREQELQRQIQDLQRQLEELQREQAGLVTLERSVLDTVSLKLKETQQELQRQIQDLQRQLEELQREQELQRQIQDLQRQLEEERQSREQELQRQIQDLQRQLEELQREQELQRQIQDLQRQLEELQREQAGLVTLERSVLDTVSLKLKETQQELQRRVHDLQRQLEEEWQSREQELQRQIQDLQRQLEELQREQEFQRQVQDLQRQLEKRQSREQERQRQIQDLQRQLEELQREQAGLVTLERNVLDTVSLKLKETQQPLQPWNCWPFKGSQGYLVIRLSMRVIPTAFSLESMPKALAPSGRLNSTSPKDFTVQGLDDENQVRFLGRYTYEEDGEALQTFTVTQKERSFQMVEVQLLSNWGHQEYTCMYRFRVHGRPSSN